MAKRLTFVAICLAVTACAPASADQQSEAHKREVDYHRQKTVTWCDGFDKVWSIVTTNGAALAVVANHNDCP